MLSHTKGIVIHTFSYSESDLISKIYTEQFGLQSYIIKGAKKAKSKHKPILFQPMNIVEITVYHKENTQLDYVKEIKIHTPFFSLHSDIKKSTVLLFLSEILYKSIKEHEQNLPLYQFISDSIQLFDLNDDTTSFFHILFISLLTKHLGFTPQLNQNANTLFFNPTEGRFTPIKTHKNFDTKNSLLFLDIFINPYLKLPTLTRNERMIVLELLLIYYQAHIPSFKEIRSLEILKTVFE